MATRIACVLLLCASATLSAQAKSEYPTRPSAMPSDVETALAESAAPAEISSRADIYVLGDTGYVRIRVGTNGCACMVSRDLHAGSLYPMCFDREGAKTSMAREMKETSLRARGLSESQVHAQVMAGQAKGTLWIASRPSLTYMMSPRQVLFSSPDSDGVRVGAWFPHVMLQLPTGGTASDLGLAENSVVDVIQVNAEEPGSELIVKVPTWSDGTPAPQTAKSHRPTESQRYGSYYELHLRVDPVQGVTAGLAKLIMPSAGRQIELFAMPALTIDSIWRVGRRVGFKRRGDTLLVGGDAPTASGATETQIFYHGIAAPPAFSMEPYKGLPTASTYGLPYSARAWWPAPGSTLAKADSADLFLTVPSRLMGVSNGRLVSVTADSAGWRTYHWSTRHPIYPDVMSLAVASYVELRDSAYVEGKWVPIRFYVFADDSTKARVDFARMPRVMEFYSRRFGPYPFADEKYGIAEFTTQSFREHQTVPSLGPQYLTGDRHNEWIFAHELAHQWFGNSLSVRHWNDVWLNEGLATYAAMLWKEEADGHAAYEADIAAAKARTFQGSIVVADSMDVDHMFNGTTFFKAALMLDSLRQLLGDDRFFTGLKTYVSEHAYGLVTTADFQRAMENASGRSLDAFFREWLGR